MSVRPIPTATLAIKTTDRLDATKTEVGGEDIWSAVEKTESTSPRMKRTTGMTSSCGRDSIAGPSACSAFLQRVRMSVNRSTALLCWDQDTKFKNPRHAMARAPIDSYRQLA
jgi:hypothetical protein